MLSKEEKKELLQDSKSLKRRNDFKLLKKTGLGLPVSLDKFISFLDGINNLLPTKVEITRKPITSANKL